MLSQSLGCLKVWATLPGTKAGTIFISAGAEVHLGLVEDFLCTYGISPFVQWHTAWRSCLLLVLIDFGTSLCSEGIELKTQRNNGLESPDSRHIAMKCLEVLSYTCMGPVQIQADGP